MTRRHIITESGAHYEVNELDKKLRRVDPTGAAHKRGDGRWIKYHNELPDFTLGMRLTLVLDSLAPYGSDDFGNIASPSPHTTRITTPVREDYRAAL